MINHRTKLAKECPEKSTYYIYGNMEDEEGEPLTSSDLTTLTLTLYNVDTVLTIVNSVSGTNILNTGRGALDVNGFLEITLLPADNAMVDSTLDTEQRIALVQWTWDSGTKSGKHEYAYVLRNLNKVS